MSQNKKLVPKRRFKKFKKIEEWKLSYLGDLLEFYSGLTYSPKNIVEKGGTLVLRSSNVKDCELVLLDKVYVDSIYVNSEFVRYGDIIVVVRNGSKHLIGKHALIKKHIKNTVIGAFMTGIRYKIPEFMNSLLDTKRFNNEIEKNLGATINQITIGHFRKMMFYIPDDIEQKDIGAFFSKLDTLIQTQQKKLDKTKTLKSAYLAEMFPCDGELKPKLRFNGFCSDWQFEKIDNVANRYNNLRIPITASNRMPGSTPYYGANGIQDYVKGFTHDGEYILVAEDGANDLLNYPVQHVKGKIWVNNHAHVLQGKINICDNKFLMYAFKCINMEPYLVGGGRAKLNSDVMMNIIILAPDIREQTKIGNFFKLLDQKIALEQRKLEKLNNIKQAYLNEMFV